ncbi:hypothetical protein OEZ85_002788 [Tetradesmus obliquus]|uniref:Protein kinase domain-containing protein n=1 Tax=Tetradesmus obliquus TaxID=3088 RepID=A0ABY8U1A5_TETOB|nr:hypothetical protein OEZ85_002788 [Tetradesmus obliquus]
MKEMRSSMEASENEQLKVLMAGFRGQNLDESDFANANVRMRLVTDLQDEGLNEALPLAYDPEAINRYWDTRPTAVITRITQLMGIAGNFISGLVMDFAQGKLKDNEVKRAIQLRDIVTSLGPAYIKLGQALSIRPDILSPAAMNELQKLCDKVPSFDSAVAMQVINDELGAPWYEIYADLTPEPIAAASLGQVYRGRLKTGEEVAVKVQRPGVLETVTVDLYIIRKIGLFLRQFPQLTTDVVALLDEWAARFFDELDYVKEGQNATLFAAQMAADLPQVVVPSTYSELTSRRVLTVSWLDGEKLSQSKADDVGDLVNIGVICYLKQLLDTGFFHADPHPGNLIRTPDGRLAILDFGLMTQVDDEIKFGMIEAISHLIHRDYEAIVQDFVTLQFIPPGTDLQPILPVLAKVFDQALEGGGAKNINFQELAADLAQITFDYPFRIPPYFALIIRAIGVLEGIALVGDPEFALVDEAYPYIAKRLLTDESPRLQAALRYMVYGKQGIFDADRLIDLLNAFESFAVASQSSRGDMDQEVAAAAAAAARNGSSSSSRNGPFGGGVGIFGPQLIPQLPQLPLPLPVPGAAFGDGTVAVAGAPGIGLFGLPANRFDLRQQSTLDSQGRLREALRFIFSPEGSFFRTFLLDEVVKSIDALSREQLVLLVQRLGLAGVRVPVLLPGARQASVPLSPHISEEDRQVVDNVVKIVNFLTKGSLSGAGPADASLLLELLPVLPTVAREVLPQVTSQLISRISARAVRELYT